METGTDLEHRRHPADVPDRSLVRLEDPRDALQKRRLTGAVVPEQAERLALRDLEVDVLEGPELVVPGPLPLMTVALSDRLRSR
jgi:hypothetical protein